MRTVHGEPRPKCFDFSYVLANLCLLLAKLEGHLQTLAPHPKRQVSWLTQRKKTAARKAIPLVPLESVIKYQKALELYTKVQTESTYLGGHSLLARKYCQLSTMVHGSCLGRPLPGKLILLSND